MTRLYAPPLGVLRRRHKEDDMVVRMERVQRRLSAPSKSSACPLLLRVCALFLAFHHLPQPRSTAYSSRTSSTGCLNAEGQAAVHHELVT